MLFGYIILAIVGLFIFGLVLNSQESRRVAKKASQLLKTADQKYGAFIEDRINISIMENNQIDFNQDVVIDDSMIILKPYIEGLIANVNATKNKEITLNYDSEYFSNIPAFLDSLYAKSQQNQEQKLSQADEADLYATFRDTVKADVVQRFVNLKTRAI